MYNSKKETGNFIDALLCSLELWADVEETYKYGEIVKRSPDEKKRAIYLAVEKNLQGFQEKTGFTPASLLKKWKKEEQKI